MADNVEEVTEDQQIEAALGETSEVVTDPIVEATNESEETAPTAELENLSEFNPTDWQLNVSGKQVTPTDRNHLINLAQMGSSYSDNMAKLNEDRRVMAEQNAPLAQYKQMDEMFKSNPEFQKHMANAIQQFSTTEKLGEETPAYVQDLLQRVESVESYKSELQQKNADKQLMNELDTIKNQYPNSNWDVDNGQGTFTHQLLKHAYDNNINSLSSAYRDLMFDNVALNAKAQALKDAETNKQKAKAAGKVGTTTATTAKLDTLAYDKNLSYNDLMEKALAMV